MAELFPTKFRALGVSTGSFLGNIPPVIGPFIYNFLANNDILPEASNGVFAIIGLIIVYFSKETYRLG